MSDCQEKPAAARQMNLAVVACHLLWRELSLLTAQSSHLFLPVYLRQGLHNEPDRLRKELQEAIDQLDGKHDAILVGYGLCSNGICGLHAAKSDLIFMRAHDCITFLLGSRQAYRQFFDDNPGTYWYSSGWIETGSLPGPERHELLRQQYTEQYDEETADYLISEEMRWIVKYHKACYIHQPGLSKRDSQNREFTRGCASAFGWEYEELGGDMQLMRDFVNGPWDDDRFLVVKPGQTVQPSYDSLVIHAVETAEAEAEAD